MKPRAKIYCPGGTVHTIVRGDTYYKLAQRHNTTVDAIRRANPGVDENNLQIGQKICIPVSPQPAPCPGGTVHTIAAGNTYYNLAQRYNTTVDAIRRANPGVDENNLQIGQKICIPVSPQPAPCPGGTVHTIVAGNTYYNLAKQYNTTVDAIRRANPGVDENNLQIGQKICIPVR